MKVGTCRRQGRVTLVQVAATDPVGGSSSRCGWRREISFGGLPPPDTRAKRIPNP